MNQIIKIQGLEQLTNLHTLNLSMNRIAEIQGLEQLTNLHILNLSMNQIKEIRGLEALTNLQELYLEGNPIRKDEAYLIDKGAQEVVKYCQEKANKAKNGN
jgi:Leucine-rich repeat (LRR) protein